MSFFSFQGRQRGAISPSLALMLVGALTFMAVVVETIRLNTASSRLSGAADAALYSGADSENGEADAAQLLAVNSASVDRNGMSAVDGQLMQKEGGATLTVSTRVAPEMTGFIPDSTPVRLSQQVAANTLATTLEIALMLDVSDSMSGGPMTKIKQGLKEFGDIVFSNERRNHHKAVSIIPATGLVNIGDYPAFFHPDSVVLSRGLRLLGKERRWPDLLDREVPGRARGAFCAQLQEDVDGINSVRQVNSAWVAKLEQPPSSNRYRPWLYVSTKEPGITRYGDGTPLLSFKPSSNDNPYLENRRDKLGAFDHADCGVSKIVPFITTKKAFTGGVDSLYSEFNTNNAEGVMWAWRLLSPLWQGHWSSKLADLPRKYGVVSNKKIMVLFSDGNHLINAAVRDKKQLELCRAMKRNGIVIYSIDFENRSPVVQACASSGNYYRASSRNIRTVMKQIALSIDDIVLTR
ncbi:pilus assembly protein TadG-related protein [Motilimonas cestriensis]|uniref:Pilus assembly protein FlpL n=1 Tax=Motilimonas cestriensis TaxID=2742685 RepID=A0ABS8WER0_9GAMM|nr:pilus assembly protein TadG-related protein [Motilimonas cestriensis]MCE2596745.1 pilus assembly protein FlpL [Motilimonas cestriensis]